ncbi:securin [Pseudoliparis swirei]|uniref:securin n=1 Tax=Pseudoliparis swirei TaxID=2059687 RepID=UPI0024BECFD1|nr:securin [Pseudoliparis swirei]
MDNIIFAERENTGLHPPNLKMRQRLQSVPEKLLSPMSAKTFHTPLPFGRRAFGAVNKRIATPVVGTQETLKPQETKVKNASLIKMDEYPEIEKFIPYDPLEFEKYSTPEDLILLGDFALPGLAHFPQAHLCEDDLDMLDPLPNQSPVKMPTRSDHCSELDAFLQTLDELTVELPSEESFTE